MHNTAIVHLTVDKKRTINQEASRVTQGSVEGNSETTYL